MNSLHLEDLNIFDRKYSETEITFQNGQVIKAEKLHFVDQGWMILCKCGMIQIDEYICKFFLQLHSRRFISLLIQ